MTSGVLSIWNEAQVKYTDMIGLRAESPTAADQCTGGLGVSRQCFLFQLMSGTSSASGSRSVNLLWRV
jgi:hypothetical protein